MTASNSTPLIMPTVCFKTIGCRLNQAETAQMAAQFESAGYRVIESGQPCDVAVVNTCTITHSAERDCAQWARRLRRNGARIVVLAGCAVEHNGEQLKASTGCDMIADQSQKFDLPGLLAKSAGIPVLPLTTTPVVSTPLFSATRALVKTQDGCDFRCSYCIVPDTRGTPRSRPLVDVIDDIRRLADAGHREITLTGANLGCYNFPPHSLIHLLEAAENVNGIDRLRIGSIESTTVEREVIDFMAVSKKLCHFLHLPLQSGDDGVLQKMRRRYTVAQYRETVEYAVSRIPDLGLGTDVIVGFPGETDSAFNNTARLIRDLPFSNLHVFPYSIRTGTPAADMPDQVNELVKKERTTTLIALGHAKRNAFAESFLNRPVTLLVEQTDEHKGASGWTGQYLPIRVYSSNLQKNDIVTCRPERLENETLVAYSVDNE